MNLSPAEKPPGLATYLKGFTFALILTLLAFGLVIVGAGVPFGPITLVLPLRPYGEITLGEMPRGLMMSGIFFLAILQILIHLRYFLHLGFGPSQRWNVLALLFTALIMIIMAGGTLWLICSLDSMMMPGRPGAGA